MSHNLLEELIADGRVRQRPYRTYLTPTVLDISLDLLRARLRNILRSVYVTNDRIRNHYVGTRQEITTDIETDIDSLVDFSILICYNRLRAVAERYSSQIRSSRCNPRAPVNNRMEFPAWISSLLGSIGPLRVPDAANDLLIIYVPPPNTMNNYGRAEQPAPTEGGYHRLTTCFRNLGFALTPIDMSNLCGSFWTTCEFAIRDNLYCIIAPFHPSHYTNDDVVRSFVYSAVPAENPFAILTMTYGVVDDETTTTALAAVAAPADAPNATANGPTRPVGGYFNVNLLGITPAVAARGTQAAIPASINVIGRGSTRIFASFLANHITAYEIHAILRQVLTSTGAPPAAP